MKCFFRCFSAFLFILTFSVQAEVKLPSIVGDGMVLQRDVELKIWGWADPAESVEVSFRGKTYQTTTSSEGEWSISMDPLTSGGPFNMTIAGTNEIVLRDIYIGDVWVCSGQSNMTHTFVRWQEEYATEIAESANPEIRQFAVPTHPVLTGPLDDVPGLQWQAAAPDTLLDFTVVGYFHAKKLYDYYHVPQGILMTCVGGTLIEAWTSEEGFKEFPEQLAVIEQNKDSEYVEKVNAEAKASQDAIGYPEPADAGMLGDVKWFDPTYQPKNWKPIQVPGYWEDQGVRNLDGIVWYRKTIEVPESLAGQEAKVKLGRIINAEEFYVNGEMVGKTTYQYPQRRYTIPAGLLKAGENVLVVRLTNRGGKGGFVPDKPYSLAVGDLEFDLSGTWQYRVGEVFKPRERGKPGINAQSQPAALYNGMVAPFVNYGIRGILWYQGESNAGNPTAYRELLPNLIKDWRSHWGMGDDVTFLIAQLPKYMDVNYLPEESNWALMRDVQMKTAQSVPNTGVGVNIDLGEWNDIHPGEKKPVGERLALQAMKLSYGEIDLVASGPIATSCELIEDRLVLKFDSVGAGLTSSNREALAHFAVAGADKQFVWADAKIDGETVVLEFSGVSNPEFVRYAWADNPDFANLANKDGLPAAPFEIAVNR